jgi:hypothetical protein
MPKFDFYPSFNAGEVSPFIDARTTLEKYRSACRTMENFQILPYGGAVRRPGFRYVGDPKRSATRCRLVGFNFSTTTRFILEIGVGYIRFWKGVSGGAEQIQSTGFPLEVVTPYDEDSLRELQFSQVNDIMYFAHARYPVYKLSRVADNNWTFATVDWFYPPLREVNVTDTTVQTSGTTGSVTITASSAIFDSGHIGSQWRVEWPRTITSGNIEMNITAANVASSAIDVSGAWDLTTYGTWNATVQVLRIPSDVWKAGPIIKNVTRLGAVQPGTEASVTHFAHGFATGDLVFFSNAGAPFDITASPTAITVVDANLYKYSVANSGPTSSSVLRVAKQNPAAKSVSRNSTQALVSHVAHGFATGDLVYFSDSLYPFNTTGAVAITVVDANSYRYTVVGSGSTSNFVKIAKVQATNRSVSRVYAPGGTVATVDHVAHGYTSGDLVHFTGGAAPFNLGAAVAITVTTPDAYTFPVANSGATSGGTLVENISKMELVREYDSNADRNIITSGSELERCGIKLFVKAWVSATNARATLTVSNYAVGGQVKITAVANDGLSATGTVQEWLGADSAGGRTTKLWYEAAFSGSRGYPRSVAMHEQRLCFGGATADPNTLWCSAIDDFENFAAGPNPDDALSFTLAASEGNRINWMYSQSDLLVGTSGDEWTIGSADTAQTLSATNVQANRQSSYGSKYMRAALVNDVLLFVQRNGRKVRELVYELNKDGWIAPDLTLLAEHVTKGEVVELAYQQQPDAILWCVRGDGQLIGMTYERDQKVVGWHRHVTAGTFESVATIYGIGTEDEVWVVVNRTVDGAPSRTIERFSLEWRNRVDNEDVDNWRYLDSHVVRPSTEFDVESVTLSGSDLIIVLDQDTFNLPMVEGDYITFANVGGTTQLNSTFKITLAIDGLSWKLLNPTTGAAIDATGWGTYTSGGTASFRSSYPVQSIVSAAGNLVITLNYLAFDYELQDGDSLTFAGVGGMTQLNGTWRAKATADPQQFLLVNPSTSLPVDATGWGTYTSGGLVQGLTAAYAVPHLSGNEVVLYKEGGVYDTQIATRGRVVAPNQPVCVGLPYTSTLRPMKLDMEMQDGTSQGRKKRIHQILARTYKSRGGEIRTNAGDWYALATTGVTTGDQKIVLAGAFGIDADIDVRQTKPFPLCLLALEPKWDAYGNE